MFENIIGLDDVTSDLARDVATGALPQAMLLTGPRYGGKSSVALEIARALTCHGSGSWGCTCRSCRLQRGLQHQDTVMVGERYFDLEISAALASFVQEPRAGTAFLLVRSVRKLLRRFDAFLWPDARVKKAESLVSKIEETLEGVEPADARDTPWSALTAAQFTSLVDTLAADTAKLQQQLPHDPVPVDMVRAIGSWAHISSSAGSKVLIMEEAHQLQEAARNAMLKLLEEPPSDVYLVLTTSRRTAMIPTLLSRLRVYPLHQRTPEMERTVQERIFRVAEPEQPHLQEFFRHRNRAAQTWREVAGEIINAAEDSGTLLRAISSVRELVATGPPRKNVEYLLDALLEELRGVLRSPLSPSQERRITATARAVHAHWERLSTRNMNPLSVVESLSLSMREIAGRYR